MNENKNDDGTTATSSSSSRILIRRFLIIVILPILLSSTILFIGIDVPPPTYGTGGMFDTIATRYDTINRILAMGMDINWRRIQVNSIANSLTNNVKKATMNERIIILDVATGTADVAIQLAHTIPNATIIGMDPSTNMLSIGRKKVTDQHFDVETSSTTKSTITLITADAQYLVGTIIPTIDNDNSNNNNKKKVQKQIQIQPNYFHAGTMSFGIRNVPDRVRALCQIHTVLKNNAQFNILEFSNPTWETFTATGSTNTNTTTNTNTNTGIVGTINSYIGVYVVSNFIQYIIPTIGGILSGQPRAYWHLQKSIADFPTPINFIKLVQNLSCPFDDSSSSSSKKQRTVITKSFHVKNVQHLNFGSVQLYELVVVK